MWDVFGRVPQVPRYVNHDIRPYGNDSKNFWKQQNSAWEADFATFACMKLSRSVFFLILRPIQNLKALSFLTCKVYNWSWEEFWSILKTSRAIFSIPLSLFEKINFLHQQKRKALQIASFAQGMLRFALQKSASGMSKFDFFKMVLDVSKWRGMCLGVFPESQGM